MNKYRYLIMIMIIIFIDCEMKSQNLCDAKQCISKIFLETNISSHLNIQDTTSKKRIHLGIFYLMDKNNDSLEIYNIKFCDSVVNLFFDSKIEYYNHTYRKYSYLLSTHDFKILNDTASLILYTYNVFSPPSIKLTADIKLVKRQDEWVVFSANFKNELFIPESLKNPRVLEDEEDVQFLIKRHKSRVKAYKRSLRDKSLKDCKCY